MKRLTTILCSLMFLIAGVILSHIESTPQNQVYAAPITISRSDLPLDLQLNMAKHDSVIIQKDTIIHHDTVQVVKYKTKYIERKKAVEPDSLQPAVKDTLYVPELKIRIQMSEDVLMDTTITVKPENCKLPN